MKFYTIFTKFNVGTGKNLAIFKEKKTGRYYISGARLEPLIFTDRKKAQAELAKLHRVEGRLFYKDCFIAEGIIRPL